MAKEVNILDLADYVVLYLNSVGIFAHKRWVGRILYYVQAWHLVYFDKHPLFNEVPDARGSGPVHPSIAEKYDDDYYIENPIAPEIPEGMGLMEATQAKLASLQLEENQIKLIHSVFKSCCELSFAELLILNNYELPWLKARAGLGIVERGNRKVTFRATYAYFNARKIRREKREEKERKAQERKNNPKVKPNKIDNNG